MTYQEKRRSWMIENRAFLIAECSRPLRGNKKPCTPSPTALLPPFALIPPTAGRRGGAGTGHLICTETEMCTVLPTMRASPK